MLGQDFSYHPGQTQATTLAKWPIWESLGIPLCSPSPAQILDWMKQILPWLEQTEWISGYAWFSPSIDNLVGTSSALFDQEGNLTALGKYYQSITTENTSGDQSITNDLFNLKNWLVPSGNTSEEILISTP